MFYCRNLLLNKTPHLEENPASKFWLNLRKETSLGFHLKRTSDREYSINDLLNRCLPGWSYLASEGSTDRDRLRFWFETDKLNGLGCVGRRVSYRTSSNNVNPSLSVHTNKHSAYLGSCLFIASEHFWEVDLSRRLSFDLLLLLGSCVGREFERLWQSGAERCRARSRRRSRCRRRLEKRRNTSKTGFSEWRNCFLNLIWKRSIDILFFNKYQNHACNIWTGATNFNNLEAL